eukprot:4717212-Prymnesium_polylepis.1
MRTPLRVVSYNMRVDHTADAGTVHRWDLRRPLAASSLLGLQADVIGLQEPSPTQAADLAADLGPFGWCVRVLACDPAAWSAAGESGPDAQARDGNGF